MDEILWCDYLNETSSTLLSHGTFYLVLVLNFEFADDIILCDYSNETSSAVPDFPMVLFTVLCEMALTSLTLKAEDVQNRMISHM